MTADVTAPPSAPMLPALLEALTTSNIAVMMCADRGDGLELWYANKPAASLLGYELEEIIGMGVIDFVAAPYRDLVSQLSTVVRGGQPLPVGVELELVHKERGPVAVEIALGVVTIDDGIAYAVITRPIDARQHIQLSLLEADRIALVGALAAGFAHEINNPLTSVLLNLRSLTKQLAELPEHLRPQALRCVEDVTIGAERIASNVRALQTLATRGFAGRVDLAAIVTASLRLAAPTLEARATVVRHIAAVRDVAGEEARIGQAVLAMLLFSGSGFDEDAAITPARRNEIVVVVEERALEVVVEVSDNGRDLENAVVRAFDPFFRSSARGAGVGVGLGVARSVATTLGGEVTLAPRPGGGASITMRLPIFSGEPRGLEPA